MSQQYRGLMEVSRLLDIPFWRIIYAEQSGRIPEPLRIANKRAYTDHDIEIIHRHFREGGSDGGNHALRQVQG